MSNVPQPMSADAVAAALRRELTPDGVYTLQTALDARSAWIRDRLAQIGQASRAEHDPPARRAALLEGRRAVVALDQECDELAVEVGMINRLGYELNLARERSLAAEARREIPVAVKKLPRLVEHVREAMASLDASVGELQTALTAISHFERLGPDAFPLDDDRLAALLELRESLWQIRSIAVPAPIAAHGRDTIEVSSTPPIKIEGTHPKADWPRSWPFLYRQHGPMVHQRTGPRPADPPEESL